MKSSLCKKKRKKDSKNTSVVFIKNSKDKSIKTTKNGKKGKNCFYYDKEKLSCNNYSSGRFCQLCISKKCSYYMNKNTIITSHKT